ncbi:UDP-N-acetylmuramate dehydrogenase [Algoriphagus halophytocola]|uniref:UDP-N-acetylmuramate dehydrogenase n=1 Tax=Algoriphagus halophytocola TaxID=2991499 RepID=UPI0022DD62EA|nr:UDP-N-acetylmuramate dehydrogenase [Algoriphagus sp. TR-M9]WBL41241.1 UDP-N-acetylmuramate dehydrogenase [Algoriphagus sp. TR-M9]
MKVLEDFDLTNYNSYNVYSRCKRAFFPQTEKDFVAIYQDFPSVHEKVILGGGYNVILSKSYYENDFIIIGESFSFVSFQNDGVVEAEAGLDLKSLSELALQNQLSGLEIFFDIPSSLGGAVVMNAGAGGEDIKGILIKVRYLDLHDYQIKEIYKEDIGFEYRNSFFQRNKDKIVLKAWLSLKKGNPETIKAKMNDIKTARWLKQPKEYPNAGSVFKRPKGHFVGPMIEGLGLKGYSIGGAKVSEKHAGFIVNFEKASGKDIVDLANYIKKRVFDHFGVDLEIEQRII